MKPNRWISPYLRRLLIAQLCGLTVAVTTTHAQAVKDPATEPANPTQTPPDKNAKAAPTPKPKETEVTKADTTNKPEEDDAIRMSAFQVTTEKDKGYLGGNAMSGTRLNSDIDDIAASVTVITKQQLMDTAAIDINDIFAYEVSTEGTRTYTANFNDGKADVDQVALNPETANRVRGVGSANIAVGNFAASSSIPIDTYNVDAVEISRGANSSIFGVGEVSGTVNLVPASANVTRQTTRVQGSVTSYGSTRGTVDINRPIIKNMLAVRINGVVENKEFLRKPSYDKTRRYQLGLTFKPFSRTTFSASYEKFKESYSRPNSVTPREYMTYWNQYGRPSWDPTTNTWSYTNAAGVLVTGNQAVKTNGNNITDFPSSTDPTKPDVRLVGTGSNRVRPTMWIDQGQAGYFGTSFWTPTGGVAHEVVQVFIPNNYGVPAPYIDTLRYSGIKANADKSFYDWENISLAGLNSASKRAELLRLQLEQYIIKSERHVLAAQIGYFRENIFDFRRTFVGNGGDGVPLVIQPDVNIKLPDGTPNPYYGAPYIAQLSPQVYSNPINTNTVKVNLAYQLDLRHEKNFLRFLGKHNLVAYGEDYDKIFAPRSLRYIDQITQSYPWLQPSIRNNNAARFNARYYLGDGKGGNVDYASSAPDYSHLIGFHRFNQATLDPAFPTNQFYVQGVPVDTTYSSQSKQEVKTNTVGAILQSYIINDRAIVTYGRRKDTLKTRDNTTPEPASARDANGLSTNISWMDDFGNSPWLVTNKKTGARKNVGTTETKGFVLKPFRWLNLRYNESNSFKPEAYAIDLQANPLDNPNGKTKDYGVQLNLFSNKVWLRVTRFQTLSKDSRASTAGVVGSRITNMDFDPDPTKNDVKNDLEDWATGEILKKAYNNDATVIAALPPDVVLQAQLAADKFIGLDPQKIADLQAFPKALTADVESRGYEVELNVNPNKFWTVKLVGSETKNITSSIAPSWQIYRDERLPIWKTIASPYDGSLFWNTNFSGNNIPSQIWQAQNEAPMKVQLALQGKPSPQTRKYKANILSTYRLAGISSNKYIRAFTVGGAVRWEDKGAIGFFGGAPDADGLIREYDPNRPIYDTSHAYADMWIRYDFTLWSNRVKGNVQLNVRNIMESGRLQAFDANPDGSLVNYRIIDPREYVLGVSLDL